MRFGPPSGKTPVYPIMNQQSSRYFVHPHDVDPWEVRGTGTITSAIKFGVTFDLIGLTQTDEFLAAGLVDVTDCLDPDLSITSLYYKTDNGDVHKVDLTGVPFNQFCAADESHCGSVELQLRVMVSTFGVPKTWLGKVVHKFAHLVGLAKMVPISISGQASLQMGSVQVHATTDINGLGVRPIGYTLQAFRFNPNRRPADVSQCPHMN